MELTIIDKLEEWSYYASHIVLPIAIVLGIALIFVKLYLNSKNRNNIPVRIGKKEQANGIIFGYKQKVAGIGKKQYYYSDTNDEGNCLVVGGSGSGKTQGIVLGTLDAWKGTSFTIDISGDISSAVDMPNKLVFNPEETGVCYNVFGEIDKLEDVEEQDFELEKLAYLMMPEDYGMSANARYFHTEGRKILIASLLSFYHSGRDFNQMCAFICISNYKQLFSEIDQSGYEKGKSYINGFEGVSEANISGCKQATDEAISLFGRNAKVIRSVHRPMEGEVAYTPSTLEHANVFIRIPDERLDVYASLLHLITAQTLNYVSKRENYQTPHILLVLDEFASLGRLEVASSLEKIRKKNGRLMILCQSLSRIDSIYSEQERRAMIPNCKYICLLHEQDAKMQREFAEMLGQRTGVTHSSTKSYSGTSFTQADIKEWEVNPEEFARLGKELILIYPGGYCKLRKNFFFEK